MPVRRREPSFQSLLSVDYRFPDGLRFRYLKKGNYAGKLTNILNEGNVEVDTQGRLDALFGAMSGKTITYERLVS